ncbi:hypothetical protein [Flavobacterium tyrosinilyticum]|uniref:hypothetical protein n=1 Tax=Flavobacterium tyrosinilyticum TaxID=1658740 RepID=UPI00202E7812|nr:hypothetical protein [Flavobacterium tyrosinilyticum]MCM0667028.1 hypothetical protein [Flavobacterium tyrosinilyticum]
MAILDNYNLNFSNDVFTYPDNQKVYHKNANHNIKNDFLGYLLHYFKDVESINDIIADIDFILTDGYYNDEYQRDIFLDRLFVFYHDKTVIFKTQNGIFLQEVPLIDFKEILILWRAFLQTTPLHGTNV